MIAITDYLAKKPYPGRGILIGRSQDNLATYVVYFIMGRSINSQNRVFVPTPDGIKTQAYDPAQLEDPSLIIYHPVRRLEDGRFIVTNGDQTDTLRDFLEREEAMEAALATRTFEPDAPNWTPRISGVVNADGTYVLSIVKTCEGNENTEERFFFHYDSPRPGTGHFISTYAGDGDPVPSFEGEPLCTEMPWSDALSMGGDVWKSLNVENRVSLYAASISTETGEIDSTIINKHQ